MSTPYFLEFTIPGLPPMANHRSGQSTHWRKKKQIIDSWKMVMFYTLRGKPKPAAPMKRAKLTAIRGSSVEPDADGMIMSFKYIIDSLVHNGILENDKLSNIGIPDYRWERAPAREGYIKVAVEEVRD